MTLCCKWLVFLWCSKIPSALLTCTSTYLRAGVYWATESGEKAAEPSQQQGPLRRNAQLTPFKGSKPTSQYYQGDGTLVEEPRMAFQQVNPKSQDNLLSSKGHASKKTNWNIVKEVVRPQPIYLWEFFFFLKWLFSTLYCLYPCEPESSPSWCQNLALQSFSQVWQYLGIKDKTSGILPLPISNFAT